MDTTPADIDGRIDFAGRIHYNSSVAFLIPTSVDSAGYFRNITTIFLDENVVDCLKLHYLIEEFIGGCPRCTTDIGETGVFRFEQVSVGEYYVVVFVEW